MQINQWEGCYPSNWKGTIVPESMAHPAKYSNRLIRRIYEHLEAEGWVEPGDNVLDPFGGVALGALDAMRLGLNWYGVELEEKFFELGYDEYPCAGFSKDDWKRLNARPAYLAKWRAAGLCPSCETAWKNLQTKKSKQGVILEQRIPERDAHTFRGNIPLWRHKFGAVPGFGTARLFHGDSRNLLEVISTRVSASVSSPPYEGTDVNYRKNGLKEDGKTYERPYMEGQEDHYGSTPGQLGGMKAEGFEAAISSPPFLQSEGGTPEPKPGGAIDAALYARHAAGNKSADGYGTTEGQLSSMKDGGFTAAMKSPPFMGEQKGGGVAAAMNGGDYNLTTSMPGKNSGYQNQAFTEGNLANLPAGDFKAALSSPPYAQARVGQESGQEHCGHGDQYGEADGQLGAMAAEEFDAAVSSPPWEKGSEGVMRADKFKDPEAYARMQMHAGHGASFEARMRDMQRANERAEYGDSAGQLGNDSGDDFWLAARQIVEQVYAALTPGGHAVWVVKDYVKAKKIVPFCDQWRQLCEAVGFQTLHEHHAMLVHHKGTQHTLEGGQVELKTESKSFFRRLAEKNGSPRIDFETVLCMVKP